MTEPQKTSISITTGSVVRVIAVLLSVAVLFLIKDIVLAVITSVVIASALEPSVRFLTKYKIPRIGAVILVYIAVILCVGAFFYFVLPTLLTETVSLLKTLPDFIQSLDIKNTNLNTLQGALTNLSLSNSFGEYATGITNTLSVLGSGPVEIGSYVFGGVSLFLIISILSFYLSAQQDGVGDFLKIITPLEYEPYVIGLWRRAQRNIGRWIQGQFILGLLVGMFVFLGLFILGIPHAVLLAVISAIFEIIPVFGPILGAFPGIIIAFVDGGLSLALLVSGLYVIIQQLESNVIYPLVVKKIIGVPPIVVILSLLIGFTLGGFLGIVVSVPLATVFMEYLGDRERNRRDTSQII